jgi:thiamine biosynthesis lipoprotein
MIFSLVTFISSFLLLGTSDSLKAFHINGIAQGTSYQITYYANNNQVDKIEIDSLLDQLDSSLSLYKPYSLINQFNHHTRGIQMDQHMYSVVKKAIEVSTITNKSFDITCKPVIDLWNKQSTKNQLPTDQQIKNILKIIGSGHLIIKNDSLLKDNPLVQIDCDGIAQGYSVDQIAHLLKQKHVHDFVVELGGEVFARGHPPGKAAWNIALQSQAEEIFSNDSAKINISNYAVTTSGSMNKFKKIGHTYYSHVFNPNTGKPVQSKIISVTLVAKDAITADALDNALMVMGIKKSMNWLQQYPEVGVLIQYVDDHGIVQRTMNEFFRKFLHH